MYDPDNNFLTLCTKGSFEYKKIEDVIFLDENMRIDKNDKNSKKFHKLLNELSSYSLSKESVKLMRSRYKQQLSLQE